MMRFSRRDVARLLVAGAAAAWMPAPAFAQTARIRLPLHEFVANARLLGALRKGIAAMKARNPSDPLSWFYQASIHGVTDQLWQEAAKTDAEVLNVDRAKYWNQCPHKGENSANFLPWHRAYTHHFEEILRMHTGEDDFAIPYWDYSRPDQREFPKEFGILHLDGDKANNDPANLNPLFHAKRDFFLCGYEHPFTDQLPLTALTSRAVDSSRAMNSPVFFGETEADGVGGGIVDADPSTRGLLEQSPHDHIHRSVGGSVQGTDGQGNPAAAIGGMAVPPTAGFDPIFPIHHANMDRLWAKWSCLPGKGWGKLPAAAWFDAKPWFFFDAAGQEVNRPRRDYFDHRALGVRFQDEDPACTPLQLPAPVDGPAALLGASRPAARLWSSQSLEVSAAVEASATAPTRLPLAAGSALMSASAQGFSRGLRSLDARSERVTITLREAEVGRTGTTGFDVFLAPAATPAATLRPESPLFLGSLSLFNHQAEGDLTIDQTFDATAALAALNRRSLDGLEVVLVPYALTTAPRVANLPFAPAPQRLRAQGLAITRATRDAPAAGHDRH